MTTQGPAPRAPRPRRRASPAVYRRRRLVAALGLAVVTVVAVLGVQALADVVAGRVADVAGTAPAGVTTSEEPAGGDEAAASAAGGQAAGDDASGGQAAGGEAGGADETAGDDAAGEDAAGGESVSDDAVSDDAVSDDAVSDDAAGDDAASGQAAGDDASGGEPAGGEAAGAEAAGGEAAGAEGGAHPGKAEAPGGEDAAAALPAATDAPACTEESVQVLAAADSAAVGPDEDPVLSAVVRARAGAKPCAVVLGATTVGVQVSTGTELVYDSAHCPQDTSGPQRGRPVVVAPGVDSRVSVTWARVHSAPGCPAGMPSAEPGTYQVTAVVAGVASEPLPLDLHS